MRDDRIDTVLSGLTSLIVNHANMTAREQYCPGADADGSDDRIRYHKEWVTELRSIRERFENLVTGLI